MRFVIAILVAGLFALPSVAQQKAQFEVFYIKTDEISKQETVERWRYDATHTERGISAITVTRPVVVGQEITGESLDSANAYTRTLVAQNGTSYKEQFVQRLDWLDNEETTIGFTEKTDTKTGEVLERWPIFVQAYVTDGMRLIEETIFKSDGEVLTVSRLYPEKRPFALAVEERKAVRGETVLYSVTYRPQ